MCGPNETWQEDSKLKFPFKSLPQNAHNSLAYKREADKLLASDLKVFQIQNPKDQVHQIVKQIKETRF